MTVPTRAPPLADPGALVRAMAKAHRRLATDLRERAADPRVLPWLSGAHAADRENHRTAEPFESYRDAFCDQVAASWVLCAVFARTLEDRGYLPHRLAGPGAADRRAQFRAQFRYLGERDYLLHVFDAMSRLPGGREVFGPEHAPLWRLGPTSRALRAFFEELGAMEGGSPRYSFGRPEGEEQDGASTRVLGDLYQNLNEDVRRRYALLQTPAFVERFLLDNTLSPAIRERGIAVTVLDPACGSGHLLLGAYDRLFEARRQAEPGISCEESARTALGQVFGVDLNPYAAAVARFRLLLRYLDKARIPKLESAPSDLRIQVHVGDSLLSEVLGETRVDVVVANPPYITEKDPRRRDMIRARYASAAGAYSLAAPFVERIFELGNEGAFTGQITANTFMKRAFGRRLVEEVLPRLDVTEVIDTSGAFIPGHGTPTVILFGRARRPVSARVRVVMGIRGEPAAPEVPAEGKVWSSIAAHHGERGYQDDYISVVDVDRDKLGHHPWSLGGGGAAELMASMETRAEHRLRDLARTIGRTTHTGEDHAFVAPRRAFERLGLSAGRHVPLVEGGQVRDFSIAEGEDCFFPYGPATAAPVAPAAPREIAYLWPLRAALRARVDFGETIERRGHAWWEHSMFFPDRALQPLSIAFAEVATHNHFVIDRGGRVFKQTAPIIKLREGATLEEHLALVAYLNSSAACFWMKQVCFNKKGSGIGRGIQPESWMDRYAFSATILLDMPLPRGLHGLTGYARLLGDLADELRLGSAHGVIERSGAEEVRARLDAQARESEALRRRMRAVEEELDWAVYERWGLVSLTRTAGPEEVCLSTTRLRPFEVLLAREGAATAWFERHAMTPRGEASPLLEERIAAIRSIPEIRLMEAPDYKRRWEPVDWQGAVKEACESWLLARVEAAMRDPRPRPVRALAHALHQDPKARAVAEILTGSSDHDLEALLGDLLQKEAVAAPRCQRYTASGLEKRAIWEHTWDLQRREDAGEAVTIDVPPRYDPDDFEHAATVFRLRGKLDVPKERFLSYPTATPPPGATGKAGLVFGWAGWTHLEQLTAAVELWQEEIGLVGDHERLRLDAALRAKLLPLLQTMVDLLPWVRQWHDEDGETADAFEAYLSGEARRLSVSLEDARRYRRPGRAGGRGRKAR